MPVPTTLPELPKSTVLDAQSAPSALATILASVAVVNLELAAGPAPAPDRFEAATFGSGDNTGRQADRLKGWIDRVSSLLVRIVGRLPDAVSWSISVGSTIVVTVNFASEDPPS
jgi:hypothetical protein